MGALNQRTVIGIDISFTTSYRASGPESQSANVVTLDDCRLDRPSVDGGNFPKRNTKISARIRYRPRNKVNVDARGLPVRVVVAQQARTSACCLERYPLTTQPSKMVYTNC